MAKKTNSEVARVGDIPDQLMSLVAEGVGADSLETMKHHRVLNRMAIVQGMTPTEVKKKYGEGAVWIPATDSAVMDVEDTIEVTPVMFFDEYVTWRDRKDKSGQSIMARSIDRSSEIAAKCGDPNRREEKYDEGKWTMRHTHHMNFLAVIQSGDLTGTLVVLSFSRGEFRKGMSWIGAIQMRKINGAQAPLWGTKWTVSVAHRKNDKGEWYGFDVENAPEPWIPGDQIDGMRSLHEGLLKDYKEQLLLVGHEAGEELEEEKDF